MYLLNDIGIDETIVIEKNKILNIYFSQTF